MKEVLHSLIPVLCWLLLCGCRPVPSPSAPAKSAPSLAGAMTWLNGGEVQLADLKGKPVLLHFFDYSSAKCLPDFEQIREWQRRHGGSGLVVIGVLSPKHDFALNPLNVHGGLKRVGITYPVAVDSDYAISQRYGAIAVPSLVLVSKDGHICHQRTGAADYAREELIIQALLQETAAGKLSVPATVLVSNRVAVAASWIRELSLGMHGSSLGNQPATLTNQLGIYLLPEKREENRVYVAGTWQQQDGFLRHAADAEDDLSDCLVVRYRGGAVHAVMKPEANFWKQVFVQQDGEPVRREIAGPDLKFDEQGRSFVKVDVAGLYHLIESQSAGAHELRICTRGKGLSVYSISVSGVAPPAR